MEVIRMELGEPDERGRRRPVEAPGSEFIWETDCVRAYCTEGEICGVLRKVYGEYKPHNTL